MKTLVALACCLAWPALAHEVGCDGKKVPPNIKASCCGEADVHRLDPSDYSQDDKGDWHITVGLHHFVVSDKKVEPSSDGCSWIFFSNSAQLEPPTVFCFQLPMNL